MKLTTYLGRRFDGARAWILVAVACLFLAAAPPSLWAATIDGIVPSTVYSGEETSIVIFGTGFPNPELSVSVESAIVTSVKHVSDRLLIVKIEPYGYGESAVAVTTPEGEVVSPLELERIPKPADPQELLEEGERLLAGFQEKLTTSYMEAALLVAKELNLAPSKAAAKGIQANFNQNTMGEHSAALWYLDGVATRIYADIGAAGGTDAQLERFNTSLPRAHKKPTELLQYIFTFVWLATDNWRQGPSLVAVQRQLPFELDFFLWSSSLNDTYVRLPEFAGIGWTSFRLGGTTRLGFQPGPVPGLLTVHGLATNFVGSPLVVGSLNFGPVIASANPDSPTTGIVNLITGEIALQEHYLVTTPLLQSLGHPPFPISFASTGNVTPVSRFKELAVTRGTSATHQNAPSVVIYGRGVIPSGVPFVGGLSIIADSGCTPDPLPQAPKPDPLTLTVVNSLGPVPGTPPDKPPVQRVPVGDGRARLNLTWQAKPGTKGTVREAGVTVYYYPAPGSGSGKPVVVGMPTKTGTNISVDFTVVPPEPLKACSKMDVLVIVDVTGEGFVPKGHWVWAHIHFVDE